MYAALATSFASVERYARRRATWAARLDGCVALVGAYRREHPGGGLAKVYHYYRYHMSEPSLAGISRDRFVRGMLERGFSLELQPPRPRTTRSGARRFANRTRDLVVGCPDQGWVSDTTYYAMDSGRYHYLTFVLDVYTRRLLGWAASDSLRAEANVEALAMAIDTRGSATLRGRDVELTFHSDGGAQYLDRRLIAMLGDLAARSSMGIVAQENAFAERVNGIVKGEFPRHWPASRRSLDGLKRCVARAVATYNEVRPHDSLPGRLSPLAFERQYAHQGGDGYEVLIAKWDHEPLERTDESADREPAYGDP